ncbi:MAG: hypothetical protein AAGF79_11905 [Pseudomonadota bacterium]
MFTPVPRLAHLLSLVILALLTLGGQSAAAQGACESYKTFSRDEAAEYLAAMVSPEVTALDQLFAFEDLMCSDQPGLRELTLRSAGLSENPVIRSQVLTRALFEKEVLAIRLVGSDEMSEQQKTRLAQYPTESLTVLYKDLAAGCLSFHQQDGCNPASQATIFGTTLDLHINWSGYQVFGSFTYDHGDRMDGQITIRGLPFKAWIALY